MGVGFPLSLGVFLGVYQGSLETLRDLFVWPGVIVGWCSTKTANHFLLLSRIFLFAAL